MGLGGTGLKSDDQAMCFASIDLKEETDEVLFIEFAHGSQDAFSELHERYAAKMIARLRRHYRFDRTTAEDVAQATWIGVAREGSAANSVRSFSAWLWCRAKNRAIDVIRRNEARKKLHEYSTLDDMENLRSQRIDQEHGYYENQAERIKVIVEAVNDLPEDLKYAIRAVHFQHQTLSAVAISLGIPRTTLQSRIEKAKDYLRIILDS